MEDLREQVEGLSLRMTNAFESLFSIFARRYEDVTGRLRIGMEHIWQLNQQFLDAASKKLLRVNPALVIPEYIKKIQERARQISVAFEHLITLKESRFRGITEKWPALIL